jgi:hypothetical protein
MVGLDTGIRGSLSIADLIAEGDSFISQNIMNHEGQVN